MFWNIIGISAAALTTFAFVPQIIKVWRTKSGKDLSQVTLIQFSCGVLLWMLYGVYLKDVIIVVANAVTLGSLAILIYLYFYYKRRE